MAFVDGFLEYISKEFKSIMFKSMVLIVAAAGHGCNVIISEEYL